MVKLVTRRWFGESGFAGMCLYAARCRDCDNEYEVSTHLTQGGAEHVDVFCGNCGAYIGRMRDDWGGDKTLGQEQLIRAN